MKDEMVELFDERGDDGLVLCGLKEVDDYNSKYGLIAGGTEIRHKAGRQKYVNARIRLGTIFFCYVLLFTFKLEVNVHRCMSYRIQYSLPICLS